MSYPMTKEYSCPECEEDVTVGEKDETVWCGYCGNKLDVCRDAEFIDGRWKDLTQLFIAQEEV